MQLHIITIGEPKLAYAKVGWQEYWQRLGRYHKITVSHLKGKNQSAESAAILKTAGSTPLVALDPRGQQFSSEELSNYLDSRALAGVGRLSFAVGGPLGHTPQLRQNSALLWSLSQLTLPHDLAMLVLLEALYRASTISAGEPYHRGG